MGIHIAGRNSNNLVPDLDGDLSGRIAAQKYIHGTLQNWILYPVTVNEAGNGPDKDIAVVREIYMGLVFLAL
jgi:hypothetical protein